MRPNSTCAQSTHGIMPAQEQHTKCRNVCAPFCWWRIALIIPNTHRPLTEGARRLDIQWACLHRQRHKPRHTETKGVSCMDNVTPVPSRHQGPLAALCLKVEGPLPVLPHHLDDCCPPLALLGRCCHQKRRQDVCGHHIHMLKHLPCTVVSKLFNSLVLNITCHL